MGAVYYSRWACIAASTETRLLAKTASSREPQYRGFDSSIVPQREQRQCFRFEYQYIVSSLLATCEQPRFVHLRVGTSGRVDLPPSASASWSFARDDARARSIFLMRSPGIALPPIASPLENGVERDAHYLGRSQELKRRRGALAQGVHANGEVTWLITQRANATRVRPLTLRVTPMPDG